MHWTGFLEEARIQFSNPDVDLQHEEDISGGGGHPQGDHGGKVGQFPCPYTLHPAHET